MLNKFCHQYKTSKQKKTKNNLTKYHQNLLVEGRFVLSASLSLSKPVSWLSMDISIVVKTVLVMVLGRGR